MCVRGDNVLETQARHKAKNREKMLAYQKEYREKNKEKITENQRKQRERRSERNKEERKSCYKYTIEAGARVTPSMNLMERNARTKWLENYLQWEDVKKWKKINIDGVKFDVIQATNSFLTVQEEGKRHTIRTISKVDFYLKNSELGAK